jgi:hypothetical protein
MHASPPHTVAAASGWVVTLLVLACLLPPPANAKSLTIKGHELTLDITNTFVYTYRFDNDRASDYSGLVGPRLSQQILNDNIDDLYHQFFNTLDISLSHADFRLGARFDLNLFANTPFDQFSGNCAGNLSPRPSWCSQANDRYKNSFVPERVYFVVAKPEFDLTLGDFYVSFGRGLALNVVKQDELGQDTAVRGGKFALHHGALQLVFFGGEFNFLDLDTQTGWDAPWRAEPVLGGRFEYTLFEELIFGVHGVYLIRDDHSKTGFSASSEPRTDYEAVVGGGIEAPDLFNGLLSLAVEFDVQSTLSSGALIRGPGGEGRGYAGYANAALQIRELTVLVEGKYYDDFLLKAPGTDPPYTLLYHQPPTLEWKRAELKDNSKVAGARLRLGYNLGQRGPVELLLFANYGHFRNWKDEALQVHSPFGGLELSWMEGMGHLELNSGLRLVSILTSGELSRRDIHLQVVCEQGLWPRHSVKLKSLLLFRRRMEQAFGAASSSAYDWQEMEATLSYSWSPHMSLSFYFERQEDKSLVRGGARNYFGGSVRYYLNPGTYASLRAGENRPGLKCLSGMCRHYPAFSGAELQLVARY